MRAREQGEENRRAEEVGPVRVRRLGPGLSLDQLRQAASEHRDDGVTQPEA